MPHLLSVFIYDACCDGLFSSCRGILALLVFQVPLASQVQAFRARRQVLQ